MIRYGPKCQFAHSLNELRSVDRHPKYKTEMCKTFWEKGTCPYGKRCCFIHNEKDKIQEYQLAQAQALQQQQQNVVASPGSVTMGAPLESGSMHHHQQKMTPHSSPPARTMGSPVKPRSPSSASSLGHPGDLEFLSVGQNDTFPRQRQASAASSTVSSHFGFLEAPTPLSFIEESALLMSQQQGKATGFAPHSHQASSLERSASINAELQNLSDLLQETLLEDDFVGAPSRSPGMAALTGTTPLSSRSSSPSIAIPQHQRSTSSSLLMGGANLFPLSASQSVMYNGEIPQSMPSPRSNVLPHSFSHSTASPTFGRQPSMESHLDLSRQSGASTTGMKTPISLSPSLGEPFGVSAFYHSGHTTPHAESSASPPLFSKSWTNNSMDPLNYAPFRSNSPFGPVVEGASQNSLPRPSGIAGARSRTLTEGALSSRYPGLHMTTGYNSAASQGGHPSAFMGMSSLDSLVEDPSRQ
jgi:hypothetical protein